MASNLYIHFPFCRRKCSYCALHSRAGASQAARDAYVGSIAAYVKNLPGEEPLKTVYFGGGSPALCNLVPLFRALSPRLAPDCEFTVELHPLDVCRPLLETLRAGGVNRVSMGVQSLDDATLADMGRGATAAESEMAFSELKRFFDNAGADFIIGYPGDPCGWWTRLGGWGLRHCSVYSLQLEEGTLLERRVRIGKTAVPPDDEVLDRVRECADFLEAAGLSRYEISNYAAPGFECRHNMAVWRGEDYIGLGEGAHGRLGLVRTRDAATPSERSETVTHLFDAGERTLFRLRTKDGLDVSGDDHRLGALSRFEKEGLVRRDGARFFLTPRGMEVCDSVLSALV